MISIGISVEISGLLDARELLALAREHAQNWWMVALLIAAQAVMFTFALAGSVFLWVAAPLYEPPLATFILAAGGTLGGIGAFFFSRFLTEDWKSRIERSRAYRVLHAQEGFLTLFAMRVFPGFPHALVNYSAGILNASLPPFIIAAMLGVAIKSYIYCRVIYRASNDFSIEALLDISVIGPLILLSVLSAFGVLIRYYKTRGNLAG